MSKDLNRHFSQRRHTDSQQTNKKMLSITNHQRNANQNHNEISPYTCQNGNYQKGKLQVLARMWRKGNPCALLVGMSVGAATIENIMEFLQKIKYRNTISSNSTSGYLPKENERH